MELTYDKKADALYLYLQKGRKITKTVELADTVIVDLDRNKKVIGVEVLCVSDYSGSSGVKSGNLNISVPVPV